MVQLRLSDAEYAKRRETILRAAGGAGHHGGRALRRQQCLLFQPLRLHPTERPMAYILTANRSALLVPRLEGEHAEEFALVDKVVTYPEYPGERHPMEFLKDLLTDFGLTHAQIGVDADGYGALYGYRGPSVSQLLPDATMTNIRDDVEYMQMINSEEELNLIRESARWGNLAHVYLQEYCKVGVSETEISMRASDEATLAMIRTLGTEYRPVSFGRPGASAGFRGQVGKDSALPHAMTSNARLKAGDVLVTGAGASVWGYGSELERTMIMGEPSKKQEKYFNLMLEAQTLACDAIKPGLPCTEVDRQVRAVLHRARSVGLLAAPHRPRQVYPRPRSALPRYRGSTGSWRSAWSSPSSRAST